MNGFDYYDDFKPGDRARVVMWGGADAHLFEGKVGTIGQPGQWGHMSLILDETFEVDEYEGEPVTISLLWLSHERVERINE